MSELRIITDALINTSRWVQRHEVLLVDNGDHALLMKPDSEDLLELNATAYEIWALMATPVSASDIALALTARYGVDREICMTAVANLLRDLAEGELIAQCPAGDGMMPTSS